MNFSITSTALFFFAANNSGFFVKAVNSPQVTCCDSMGGTYNVVNTADGPTSAFCTVNDINTEAGLFYQENCAVAPTQTYSVYTVNNCDGKVTATFPLSSGEKRVKVNPGECAYVGTTENEDVTYSSKGSIFSGGSDSCAAIGGGNNNECDLLGMADNACVVLLC